MLAGFRGVPNGYHFSRVGNPFDFTSTGSPLTADLGFGGALEADQLEAIQEVFVGRHLQLFTDTSEWYVESRTLDATQPPNIVVATRSGISSAVPVAFVDGATVFAQRGGRVLRDFVYSDAELSYRAEPLNLLSPHLVTGLVDLGYRSATAMDKCNELFAINSDGTMAVMHLLRSQEIVAMAPYDTEGKFVAAGGDITSRMFVVVERNGDNYLEMIDDDTILDGSTKYSGAATTTFGGLSMHEGKEVWAFADHDLVGPLTVTGGSVTLPVAASDVVIGLMPEFRIRLPRVRDKLAENLPFRPPGRIYSAELSLVRTGHIEIAVNGGPFREVPLTVANVDHIDAGGPLSRDFTVTLIPDDVSPLDAQPTGHGPELPMLERLFTGYVRVSNLTGWSRHPTIEIRQSVPAPLELRAIQYEVATRG